MASSNNLNEQSNKAKLDEDDDDDDDPVVKMIKKTGCIDYHYKVQVNTLKQNTFVPSDCACCNRYSSEMVLCYIIPVSQLMAINTYFVAYNSSAYRTNTQISIIFITFQTQN